MNVKAIIHEVFVELSTMDTPPGVQGPPDRFLPIRRRYLDPFVDEYNWRKPSVVGKGREAGDLEGPCFKSSLSEVATKKTP